MLVGTTNLNTTLNLTYVLTDVVETLLYDLRSEMGKQGYELRYDAKRNFNTAIAAIRKLKQDVDKTQFSTQENVEMMIKRCLNFIITSSVFRHNLGSIYQTKKVRSLIFSKVVRSWISYESVAKHPPSPRS